MSTKICTLLLVLTFVTLSFSKAQGPKEDLNIILVTRESKNVVDSFLKKIQSSISIGIPSAVNNNYLCNSSVLKACRRKLY
jgi:hypothetical protein